MNPSALLITATSMGPPTDSVGRRRGSLRSRPTPMQLRRVRRAPGGTPQRRRGREDGVPDRADGRLDVGRARLAGPCRSLLVHPPWQPRREGDQRELPAAFPRTLTLTSDVDQEEAFRM